MSQFKIIFAASKMTLGFTEVSGLDVEARVSGSPASQTPREIVLRRGKALCTNEIVTFFAAVKGKPQAVAEATIQQLDPKGAVLKQWTLQDVQVTKAISTGTNTIGKEVAIDQMVILYKGVGDGARKGGGSHW